jgi:hypothetical protein
VTVVPVLALPGWFVKQTGRSPVQVYSGRDLSGLLNAGAGKSLSAQDVQRALAKTKR